VKQWYIYLLPNANGPGKPKVGTTSNLTKRIKENDRLLGKDISGMRIIDYVLGTYKDAYAIEGLWQKLYNCNDRTYIQKGGSNLKAKGKPNLKLKGVPNLKLKGKVHEIITCPFCGISGGVPIMNRWHFDKCKKISKGIG
jgi:hypothetical protein